MAITENDFVWPAGVDKTLAFQTTDWGAQFHVVRDTPSEAVATYTAAPLQAPVTVRWARQSVSDVYRGSGVDTGYYGPVRRGYSILVQVNAVQTYTLDDGSVVHYPVSGHVVLKMPAFENTDGKITTLVLRHLVSACCTSDGNTQSRLNSLLRGGLLPTDLV